MPPSPVTPSTPRAKVSQLSPDGRDVEALKLPPNSKVTLEVEFEAKARTPPRLILKEDKKKQLAWPLADLTEITVNWKGIEKPCVRFNLKSDLMQEKPPKGDNEILRSAYEQGMYEPGLKAIFVSANDAEALFKALHHRKLQGDASVKDLKVLGDESEAEGDAALIGALSLVRLSSSGTDFSSAASPSPGSVDATTLIWVCKPKGAQARALEQAHKEAIGISNNCLPAKIVDGGSAMELHKELQAGCGRYHTFVFTGHGHEGEHDKTLIFTEGDAVSAPNATTLACMLGESNLQLVFLNGCNTEDLGRQVRAAGVPNVVCWRTECEGSAASLFAQAFFEAVKNERSFPAAFQEALKHVKLKTRDACGDAGERLANQVPHYEFRAPADPPMKPEGFVQTPIGKFPLPYAAGVPLLLSADASEDSEVKVEVS